MQFVRNGPDIPERLLQAHEDGHVVLFCGAGISYPAGLPGFSGLVEQIYESLSIEPNQVQQAALDAKQFDTAINLLEAGMVEGRTFVRQELAKILLHPDLTNPDATATHEALLTLARNREGKTRLVTTNFDRLFEHVTASKSPSIPSFQAPLLHVPKQRWDGLVYLHGLLSEKPTPGELDQLVVSSGDFGLAYLIEGWAAHFVSRLFRNYTVCFVGYSINDPIPRYMMDALAADHILGESSPEMFAFGDFSEERETECANEWKAKNVTPILYCKDEAHTCLHETLRAWADTYRDGVRGKERIVDRYAADHPSKSTKQDNFVGRMLWALSDPSGLPAKRFADMDPVPPLDWLLGPLSEERYKHADLSRFGVPAQTPTDKDKYLKFSLIRRPSPYTRAPWMVITGARNRGSEWNEWDETMFHLARWLTRHLDDPKLVWWLVERGCQLHPNLVELIDRRLNELARLESIGSASDKEELKRICENAPNAIPRPVMRTLWRLLLTGRVYPGSSALNLYHWHDQFRHEGLTVSTRIALREILTPYVSLNKQFHRTDEEDGSADPERIRIRDLFRCEIVLAADDVHHSLSDLSKDERWAVALPELLDDFSTLLRDALDLMRETGDVDSKSDLSFAQQPSISDHPQNKTSHDHDWTALIVLTRDAWLATATQSPERATQSPERARIAAEAWMHTPYPVFRRLAFFAAAQERVIPPRLALDWLLADEHWWLWSEETRREAIRLLVALAPRLDSTMLAELEKAILSGPPRNDIDPDSWNDLAEEIWLRLAKTEQAGAVFGESGKSRLATLSAKHPEWKLAADESDEFHVPRIAITDWVGHRNPWKPFTPIPRTRRGVLDYLLAHPVLDEPEQDDWRERCSKSFQATAYALCKLSQQKQNNWPKDRWRDALQAWAEEKLPDCSWRYMAPVVAGAPDDFLKAVSRNISGWLEAVAKTFEDHEDHFLTLARRILQLDFEDDNDADDPVPRAINHPVGHVVQAFLDWWYRQRPNDCQELPDSIKPIFTELCDTRIAKFRHGRVLLAAHTTSLFYVDKTWSEEHLLPLFDWHRSETEARAAWAGFLRSPRLYRPYRPLMEAIKPDFLDTVNHYADLGQYKEPFAAFLTFAALDPGDTFNTKELSEAIGTLPPDGLRASTQALMQAQEAAGDRREEFWRNRVQPFWKKIWPKSKDQAPNVSAESLARLCVAAGEEFPSAVTVLGSWLRPYQYPNYVIYLLHEANLSARFPEKALDFLNIILADLKSVAERQKLRECLDAIAQAAPTLRENLKFVQLELLVRP